MLQDLRYALRTLLKTPGFLVVAVLTLALGIGANTAMFSVVKAVLLARLPYPQPDRLVQLWESTREGHLMFVSTPNALDWQAQNQSLEALAYGGGDTVTLSGSSTGSVTPAHVRISGISRDFFRVMGVQPERGRLTSAADHRQGAAPAIVISHSLWQRAFAGDPNALGRSVHVAGQLCTVVGIMPGDFDFPERSEVWMPLELTPDVSTRSAHNNRVYARLKPGVSLAAAQADMNTIAARLGNQYADDKDRGIRVVSLYDQIVGPVRPALLILLGAVGFVLLIACVNIANLQLARGAARLREMALRTALGAARTRLIRQLLTESLVIAAVGGAAGFVLALWGTELLRTLIPQSIPRVENIHADASVFAFTFVLSLAAGLLFGVLPALSASNADVNDALKEGSGKATLTAGHRRLGNSLVMAEIAIATVLLIGAGLLIQTFRNLENVSPGFATTGVLTAEIEWPIGITTGFPSEADGLRSAALTQNLLNKVRAIPGVEFAGTINSLPIKESGKDGSFEIAGRALPPDPHQAPDAWYRAVTTGYFETMAIPLLRGRIFTKQDEAVGAPQVALVNQAFVKEFFPHSDALGQRIRFFGFDMKPQFLEIVGVVNDVRSINLSKPADSEVFVSGFQHPMELASTTLVAHAPLGAAAAIRAAVASIDPSVPVEFAPVQDLLSASIARQRFQMTLLAVFAGLALLLAAVGIYGVQSYIITRRTNELGIRLALGAGRRNLLSLILREGAVLTFAGLAVGLIGAYLLTRLLSAFLYNVSATDPLIFGLIAFVLGCVAMLACAIPARRAAATDPMTALRYE